MKKLVLAATAMVALTVAAPATAQSSYSTFEGAVPAGSPASPNFVTVAQADGWTGGPNGIELQYGGVGGAPAADGGNVFVELDTSRNSYMQRALTAGSYTLGFLYSPRPNVPGSSNGISISIVDANTNAIVNDSIFDLMLAGASTTQWQSYLIDFTVDAGQAVRFTATGTSDSLGGYIDNIRLTTAVPEPATWGLMIAGFGVVGVAMRRRRSTAAVAAA